MNKIQVGVLDCREDAASTMMFLARLTQRGHSIKSLSDLYEEYDKVQDMFSNGQRSGTVQKVAELPHGTIKRFAPITVAIVGASRRFLAQARTHQVGMNYVSASLQYSDYSGNADFVIPYEVIEKDREYFWKYGGVKRMFSGMYATSCAAAMGTYETLAKEVGNDAAGYAAPQGLRNILIMQGNHESWMNFIRTRACNRNTLETQYVTALIWQALLDTPSGHEFFDNAGPDCMYGKCREGKFCCGHPLSSVENPTELIETKFPLLYYQEVKDEQE